MTKSPGPIYQASPTLGISTISNRYAKANNKYMGDAFDSSKHSSFITYLDGNIYMDGV